MEEENKNGISCQGGSSSVLPTSLLAKLVSCPKLYFPIKQVDFVRSVLCSVGFLVHSGSLLSTTSFLKICILRLRMKVHALHV